MPFNHIKSKLSFFLFLDKIKDKTDLSYLHIMHNDKFNSGIVAFINKNFPSQKHTFLFHGGYSREQFPLPEWPNVFELKKIEHLAIAKYFNKIFFHGLYNPSVVNYLYNHSQDILPKSCWLIWGGDLYEAPRDKMNTFVRKNFAAYTGCYYDQVTLNKKYNLTPVFLQGPLFSPFSQSEITSIKKPLHQNLHILVNNSAHSHTPAMLKHLAKFKNEDIKIYSILSHGDIDCNQEIIKTGHDIFANKFIPLLQYIPPKEYMKFLASLDILVLNQDRPQGLTTAYTLLLMGKKVFMKNTLQEAWKKYNLYFHNSDDIHKMSFESFCAYPEKAHNQKHVSLYFNEERKIKIWDSIFNF